jgi:hypothetical protein
LLTISVITREEKTVKGEPEKKIEITAPETAKETTVALKEEEVKTIQPTTATPPDSAAINTTNGTPTKSAEQAALKEDTVSANIQNTNNKSTQEKAEVATVPKTEKIKTAPEPVQEAEYRRSVVTRRSESSTTEGFGLVFLDKNETTTDTIRILIPNPIKGLTTLVEEAPGENKVKDQNSTTEPSTAAISNTKVKLACIYLASEAEFKRLRKAMASKYNDGGMINEAKRGFKNTCFTTEQIRNLSALFLTAEGKYNFFDAAYLHIVDRDKISSLGAEIKDDYYGKRFKALIGE